MKKHAANPMSNPYQFPAHLFRIAFAVLFIFVGIKKVRMGYGGFAESLVSGDGNLAQEIPNILLYAYGYALPAVEIIVGVLLLINRYTFLAFQVIAAIYVSFIFGQMYDENTSKIGTEYLPSLIALVAAYYFNYEHEKTKLKK